MIIERISLYNFGSYEGEVVFNTQPYGNRNIIIIGGKNGAGKTTLFTAIRLCLYGFVSMGYKNQSGYYSKSIIKLINNAAKLKRPTESRVELELAISNGHENDTFILCRKWIYADNLSESFFVMKNGITLSQEEIADFEQFLYAMIPPELFNLYFFDGERIADFFLTEGSNARIKNAFLTICGYDTFEIMRKHFKRLSNGSATPNAALSVYVDAKERATIAEQRVHSERAAYEDCCRSIDSTDADILMLDKTFQKKGGITQEQWDKKVDEIKAEEKKRENWNALLKKWANDVIPFLMLRTELEAVKKQVESENAGSRMRSFLEVINYPEIKTLVADQYSDILGLAKERLGEYYPPILDLSIEQSAIILNQINQVLSFEIERVEKCKKAIKRSIALTTKIRRELDNSSITSVQEYMKERMKLIEQRSQLQVQQQNIETNIRREEETLQEALITLSRAKSKLEEELKASSVSDISARAILLLDQLQVTLYHKQINTMEASFRKEISLLMRKVNFIDDIEIDDDFNVHLFRNTQLSFADLVKYMQSNNADQLSETLGKRAIDALFHILRAETFAELEDSCKARDRDDTIVIPVEIDKTSFSNGEKQIYIMALYHSLVSLCTQSIPFIIDTPFARIDTEHRMNIANSFFCNLSNQIFILSTNEEIGSAHMSVMKDKIAATFLLENTENQRTVVISNQYFGE